jgi:hypothetical protein
MRRASLLLLAFGCAPKSVPGDTEDPTDASADTTGTTDPTTGTTDPTTGTTATPTTGEPDATTGEPCLESVHPGDLLFGESPELTCGAAELCPGDGPITFQLAGPGLADHDFSSPSSAETDLERARCLAAALRDRTPGQFLLLPVDGGEILYIFGREVVGELALERSELAECVLIAPEPKSCHVRERLRVLRPPEFFAACVDGDALALWKCLHDAFEPEPACAPGPLVCP